MWKNTFSPGNNINGSTSGPTAALQSPYLSLCYSPMYFEYPPRTKHDALDFNTHYPFNPQDKPMVGTIIICTLPVGELGPKAGQSLKCDPVGEHQS